MDTKYGGGWVGDARDAPVLMGGLKAAEWPHSQAQPEQRDDGHLRGDIWGLETGRPGVPTCSKAVAVFAPGSSGSCWATVCGKETERQKDMGQAINGGSCL